MLTIPNHNPPILVVDDDEMLLQSIETVFIQSGLPEPALLSDSRKAMELIDRHNFQMVLMDLNMPYINGMDLLAQVKKKHTDLECVIITAVDEAPKAVEALKLGAYDYLVKPVEREKLVVVVRNTLERYNLRHGLVPIERSVSFADLRSPDAFQEMTARDPKMVQVFHQAEIAAKSDCNLIITGETGTGKGMLARAIHRLSHRKDGPFVAINLAVSNATLIEDDLFGHVKGAFTGALDDKMGFFESAQGGTLFLDELGELPREIQTKLLTVIEDKALYRLGTTVMKFFDARIICATNRNIAAEIKTGNFREDLFYRLNMFNIVIPPLRERKLDIIPLANHFIHKHSIANKKKIPTLHPELENYLMNLPLPGNVRELENIILSAVMVAKGRQLSLDAVQYLPAKQSGNTEQPNEILPLSQLEKKHIFFALKKTGGNRTLAAKHLGISLKTLSRKLKIYEKEK